MKFGTILGVIFLLGFRGTELLGQDSTPGANLLLGGDATSYTEQINPWNGVDANGNLHGLSADQLAVDNDGSIRNLQLSPSVAIGDLNGDGVPDLVVADPKGFFWFFPNHGTLAQPTFTTGEIMPVWLGSVPTPPESTQSGPNADGAVDHLVPRIQLIDISGSGKLDIVAGTFPGKLFYIRNTGSLFQPRFETPKRLDELKDIPTRRDGKLDCNYFSPFLYDWFGNGHLQLLRGDGTYSANSIFLFFNKGSNEAPVFDEQNATKIISGMGREHLTPQILDWNNDGKPDVITGERTGEIELFLNTSDDANHPTFDQGQKLKIGGQDKFGQFTTVTVGSLSGNSKVPDLIITNNTGQLLFAKNSGTPGFPRFTSTPQPLKGTKSNEKFLVSNDWALGSWDVWHPYPLRGWSDGAPFGVPYELLEVANVQKEPDFLPPSGVTWKNAIEYESLQVKNTYFRNVYYPETSGDDQQHSITNTRNVNLTSETSYRINFWIKGDGPSNVRYEFNGVQLQNPGTGDQNVNFVSMGNPVAISSTWAQVSDDITWDTTNGVNHDTAPFSFSLKFSGQGRIYLGGVELHKR